MQYSTWVNVLPYSLTHYRVHKFTYRQMEIQIVEAGKQERYYSCYGGSVEIVWASLTTPRLARAAAQIFDHIPDYLVYINLFPLPLFHLFPDPQNTNQPLNHGLACCTPPTPDPHHHQQWQRQQQQLCLLSQHLHRGQLKPRARVTCSRCRKPGERGWRT